MIFLTVLYKIVHDTLRIDGSVKGRVLTIDSTLIFFILIQLLHFHLPVTKKPLRLHAAQVC